MKRSFATLLLMAVLSTVWGQSSTIPAAFHKVLAAHGGLDAWKAQQGLVYTKGEGEGAETHIVNLWDRRTRIENPNFTIGYDGNDVWISPEGTQMQGRARFYHNLYFYFFAMPFVLADPGIYYEEMDPMELQGKMYGGVKVSYGDGVGDSPEDNYIVWYDPDTYQMEWLMYTVTYGQDGPSDKYSLIRYSNWLAVGNTGLRLPQTLSWYVYQDGVVGDERSSTNFPMISLSEEAPEASKFEKPEGAVVSPK